MARVAVVIVNFRTAGLVRDCLASLEAEDPVGNDFEVTIVDNNSGDGSAAQLAALVVEQGWGPWATVLPRSRNDGFAAGNNAAMRAALQSAAPPEFFLLLNPDTVVRRGALAALVDFLDNHPRAGIAGSRLENPDGSPQCAAFRFPGVLSEFERSARLKQVSQLTARFLVAPAPRTVAHRTDWVSGASMLVRRAVVDTVGLLDEGYFLYFEEVDWCRRATLAGWQCWHVPSSRVVHLVGQSTGIGSDQAMRQQRVPRYWFESRRRYFEKNNNWCNARLADLAWMGGFGLWQIRRLIQRRPDDTPPKFFQDFLRFCFLAW